MKPAKQQFENEYANDEQILKKIGVDLKNMQNEQQFWTQIINNPAQSNFNKDQNF